MIAARIDRKALHDSYSNLKERAKIDLDFLLLIVVAAIICAFGFKMNSPSVIIGAMVISPLLYPVICVGAATYQTDWSACARAVGTFAAGFLAAVTATIVVDLFHPTTFRSEDRRATKRKNDRLCFCRLFFRDSRNICILFAQNARSHCRDCNFRCSGAACGHAGNWACRSKGRPYARQRTDRSLQCFRNFCWLCRYDCGPILDFKRLTTCR